MSSVSALSGFFPTFGRPTFFVKSFKFSSRGVGEEEMKYITTKPCYHLSAARSFAIDQVTGPSPRTKKAKRRYLIYLAVPFAIMGRAIGRECSS